MKDLFKPLIESKITKEEVRNEKKVARMKLIIF